MSLKLDPRLLNTLEDLGALTVHLPDGLLMKIKSVQPYIMGPVTVSWPCPLAPTDPRGHHQRELRRGSASGQGRYLQFAPCVQSHTQPASLVLPAWPLWPLDFRAFTQTVPSISAPHPPVRWVPGLANLCSSTPPFLS